MANKPTYKELEQKIKELEKEAAERKRVEETLRASEERLQLVADAAQMGQWDWNIVTGKVVWSKQCLALYGLPPDTQMSYDRFLQTLHPEDRERINNALLRAVEDRDSYDKVKRTVWPDGSIHWTYSRGQVYCNATGQPTRMIGVTFDISKWKETEKALKESEAKYMDLYENAPDMYASVNAKTALIEACNMTLANTLGYPKEEIIGRPVFNIYHPDCLEEVKETFKLFVKTGEIHDKELKLRRKDGSEIDVSLNVSAVCGEDGQILFSRSTLRDITERKRNQAIISARLHLLQFAATHSLDELLEETLNEAEKLTDSLIGFYHFVEVDQKSLTLQNWSTRTKAKFCKAERKGLHYPIAEAGVWVDCVYQGKPVIHNDYASLLHRKGMPEGHVEVIRELVVPVFRGNKIKAILGVGNKPSDYTEKNVETISLLADLTWEIVERKRAELDLKESEERYRAIVAGFDGLIYICSQYYRVEFMNDKFIKRTGYYPIGELCYKALHELDSICPWCVNEQVFKGETVRWEVKSPKDDRWYYIVNTPIYHADGRVSKQAMIFDITDRKESEDALRESEEKYRQLVRHAPSGIYEIDYKKGKLISVNEVMCEFTGYTREELLSINPLDLLSEESKEQYNERLKRILSGEQVPEVVEFKIRRKDGKEVWALLNIRFMYEGKEIEGATVVAHDISNRKLMEEALRESEEKHRIALEASPDPIVVYDMEGKVTYFNPAFTHVFGWTLEERLGKKMDVFVPEEALPETKMMIEKVIKGKRFSNIETRRYTKKGEIIPVSISGATYRDRGGNPLGSVINLRDIREQKKLETQLRQAQKMESIGTLAGGIAHDFNNILSPIILYTELILNDLPSESQLRFNLEEVHSASMRAKDLVKQILTFSHQAEQEKIPLKISPIIKEVLKLLRASLPSTIEIRQNIEVKDSVVLADPTQIHQILMNLCTNAAHSMRERGGVLEVSLVDVDLHPKDTDYTVDLEPGQYIKLTVSDTGHGIEPAIMVKIFDPYFTTQEKGKGTGLGLSVVHGIVSTHGGQISVNSEPDKGTRFDIYLPLVDSTDMKSEMVSPEKLATGHEHVLLVDDEKQIVDILKQILERLGYQVTARTSSVDVLEMFRADPNKFDLIITDMTMPNMTGTRLAKELLNIRPGIPVIICTGNSEIINDEIAKAIGISGYIMKPVVTSELAKRIREVFD